MKHLLKFNESNDPNIGLIQDVFLGLEDDFNIKARVQRITDDETYIEMMISEIISRIENKTITPKFIGSVASDGDYHIQFRSGENFDRDVELVKKYAKYKTYRVSIDWSNLKNKFSREEFSSILKKYSNIAESYGFMNLYDELMNFGPAVIVFAHE